MKNLRFYTIARDEIGANQWTLNIGKKSQSGYISITMLIVRFPRKTDTFASTNNAFEYNVYMTTKRAIKKMNYWCKRFLFRPTFNQQLKILKVWRGKLR